MSTDNRPLSPHLQIYRPQLTTVLSILHRATGVAAAVGSLLVVYWLVALASGPAAYERAQGLLGSVPGLILLFLFTFALMYHLCNGVRHLFWDAGKGLDLESAYRSGYAAVAGSALLTVAVWIVVFATGGA